MTYPHPSEAHQELVCTAGITEDLEWVRLYPIDYRYRPKEQQFHKYQWIEIALAALKRFARQSQPVQAIGHQTLADREPVRLRKVLDFLHEPPAGNAVTGSSIAVGNPVTTFPAGGGDVGTRSFKKQKGSREAIPGRNGTRG